MGGVPTEEYVVLKPKMYLCLVSNSSKYKKEKGMNKNLAAKINYNEYKYVLLNEKEKNFHCS